MKAEEMVVVHERGGGPPQVPDGEETATHWVVTVQDDEPVNGGATAGTGSNRMALLFPSSFGGLILWFIAAALIGTAPRCFVLLASQALPQVAPSQAVDAFMDSWQTCADDSRVFSDFSADGLVYKVMVASDHAFTHIGITMAVMVALSIPQDAPGSQRAAWLQCMVVAAPALVLVGVLVRMFMVFSSENVSFHDLDSLDIVRASSWVAAIFYMAIVFAMLSWCSSGRKIWRPVDRQSSFRIVVTHLPALGACVCCYVFVACMEIMFHFFAALLNPLSSIVLISIATRSLNLVLRVLVSRSRLHHVQAACCTADMCSMIFLSHAALMIRKSVLNESNEQLSKVFINFLTLGVAEVIARGSTYFTRAIVVANHLQYSSANGNFYRNPINSLTLDGLLDVHAEVERHIDHLTVFLSMDQFVEIFVCIMIASQELSAPVWSLYRTWMSAEAWHDRVPFMLASASIQMGVELTVDRLIWLAGQRVLPLDVSRVFRRILAKRCTVFFVLGVMQMSSVTFFPNCMTCRWPVHCVLFTECLFDGEVMVNGQNACSSKVHNRTNYAELVLLERRSHTQGEVSPEQLGCGRQDGVDCFGLGSSNLTQGPPASYLESLRLAGRIRGFAGLR